MYRCLRKKPEAHAIPTTALKPRKHLSVNNEASILACNITAILLFPGGKMDIKRQQPVRYLQLRDSP